MALVKGGVSTVAVDVGSTSKGLYSELIDSTGKLGGATKTMFSLTATNFTAAGTEAMVTCTPARDWVNGSTGTSFAVSANKRLVILGITVATKNASTAGQGVICRVRINPGGAAIATSPILVSVGTGTSLAIAGVVESTSCSISQNFPSLIELSSTAQIGISQIGTATAGNDVTLWGYEY